MKLMSAGIILNLYNETFASSKGNISSNKSTQWRTWNKRRDAFNNTQVHEVIGVYGFMHSEISSLQGGVELQLMIISVIESCPNELTNCQGKKREK